MLIFEREVSMTDKALFLSSVFLRIFLSFNLSIKAFLTNEANVRFSPRFQKVVLKGSVQTGPDFYADLVERNDGSLYSG